MATRTNRISSVASTTSTSGSTEETKSSDYGKFILFKLCNLLLYSFLWAISVTGVLGSFYFRVMVPSLHMTTMALEKVMYPTWLIHKVGHHEMTTMLAISIFYMILGSIGFIVSMKENYAMLGIISSLGFGCLFILLLYFDIDPIRGNELYELLLEDAINAKKNKVNMSNVEDILECCWGENIGLEKPSYSECIDCVEVLWLFLADKNELVTYFVIASVTSQSLMSFFLLCFISFRPPKQYIYQDEEQEETVVSESRIQRLK